MPKRSRKWPDLAVESYLVSHGNVDRWTYNDGLVDWIYSDETVFNMMDDLEERYQAVIDYVSKVGSISRSDILSARQDPDGRKFYRYEYQDLDGSGKTVIAFYACAAEGGFDRFIEYQADGKLVAYSLDYMEDDMGFLPEGAMDEEAARDFGCLTEILKFGFDEIWNSISPSNGISIG